ncbi:hypothetical protein D3C71_1720490 [compost metagenome]
MRSPTAAGYRPLEPPTFPLAGWTLDAVFCIRLALGLTHTVGVALAVPHTGFLFTIRLLCHLDTSQIDDTLKAFTLRITLGSYSLLNP